MFYCEPSIVSSGNLVIKRASEAALTLRSWIARGSDLLRAIEQRSTRLLHARL